MSRKIRYQVYTAGTKLSERPMRYNFSNTKNICMTVSQNGFNIQVDRIARISAGKVLEDILFRDAVKKACLIQLIKYGRINLKSMAVAINDEETLIYDSRKSNEPLIYGMCGASLISKMSENWGAPQFERILKTTKTKTDRLDASLYALLTAKSKVYATERFMYLWMSFNGLYGYIAEKAAEYNDNKSVKNWIGKEYGQLKFVSMLFEHPYRAVEKNYQDSFRFDMELALAKVRTEEIEQFIDELKNNVDNEHIDSVKEILSKYGIQGKMSEYAALSIYFPYLIRCKYFHGEKAIPFFCYKDEHPLPVLRVLNTLLERFLDDTLYRFMDEEELNNELLPRIEVMIKACKVGKNGLESCVVNGEELA